MPNLLAIMSTPAKGATKKEKKKPIPVKTSLNNPYNVGWSELLQKQHKHLILNTLKEKISGTGLRKERVSRFREWGSRKRSRKDGSKPTEDQKPASEPTENVQTAERGWTNPALRKQLAIGINEVTKGLERNDLSLVLVCNSVTPAHMTSHLIPLSKTRSVPACQVPGLSGSLSELLGLKCVLALGFRRGSEEFEDTVRAITPVVPQLSVAWMQTVNSTPKTEKKRTDTGQKRKLEELSSDASPLVLQPLKVKKIIPNPTKIRKPKLKRKKKVV